MRKPSALLLAIVLLLGFLTLPSSKADAVSPKIVLGFYTVYYSGDTNSYKSLSAYSSYLNAISTVTFNLRPDGNLDGSAPADAVKLASSKHIDSYAVITNLANGKFDPEVAHAILGDEAVRQTAIHNLLQAVKTNGYRGVNIDFENMVASDRADFSQFIAELSSEMRANGYKTMVSASAKTGDFPASSWSGTFDYAALGKTADYVQLMTYDENGPWGSPGPVSGYAWVNQVVKYAVSQIPSSKILIGLPAYGYEWNTTAGTGESIAWKNVPSLLSSTGATPGWDSANQSPYLNYTAADGTAHTVWYENAASIRAKSELVTAYNLAGVAVWSLRAEDESFWQAVREGFDMGGAPPAGQPTPQPAVKVTTTSLSSGKTFYEAKEDVFLTAKVTDGSNQPVSGASVELTVRSPIGKVTMYTGTTDAYGLMKVTVWTAKQSPKGLYKVSADTALAGFVGSTASTPYLLQ